MANTDIKWRVGLELDSKDLQTQLTKIQSDVNKIFTGSKGGLSTEMAEAANAAALLESSLKKATTDRGVSFTSLELSLKKANSSAADMVQKLAYGGDLTKESMNVMLESYATAHRNILAMSAAWKDILHTIKQSAKYSFAQAGLRYVTSQLRQSIQWVQDLNKQVNQIAIVSGKSGDALEKVYKTVIDGSKQLRVAAKDYAEAAQIFYQQGLDDSEVERRTEITVKAAKAAGQSVETMSNQLTAIWNTYQMAGDEMEAAASKAAVLGASTAIEFKDIAEAMQTSASAAAQMGVSYESLASIIATVGETTRQSASIIGTAYKTIFSRFEQLKAEGTDGEVTLNRVSEQLAQLGINVLDQEGNLRNLEEVITEVGNSWEKYSDKQQLAIAEAVGGTKQYTQFLAFMNNFDKYQRNLKIARGDSGEGLAQQYATSLESLDSLMTNAAESWRRAFSEIFNEEAQKSFYKGLEGIGKQFESIVGTLGGLKGLLEIAGVYLVRKLPDGVKQLNALWKTYENSFSLKKQLEHSAEEFDKIKISIQEVNAQMYQGGNAVMGAYSEEKVQIAQEVAEATINLDHAERNVSDAQKTQIQHRKENLALAQQELNIALDKLKTEEAIGLEYQENAQLSRQLMEDTAGGKGPGRKARPQGYDYVTAGLIGNVGGAIAAGSAVNRDNGGMAGFNQSLQNIRSQNLQAGSKLGNIDGGQFSKELAAIINDTSGSYDTLSKKITLTSESLQKYINQLKKHNEAAEDGDEIDEAYIETLEDERKQLDAAAEAQRKYEENMQRMQNLQSGQISIGQAMGTSIGQVASSAATAVSSIGMLTMSITNLAEAAKEGNLTFGNVAMTVGTIGAIAPQAMKSLQATGLGLSKMIGGLGTKFGIFTAEQGAAAAGGTTLTAVLTALKLTMAEFLIIIAAVVAAIALLVLAIKKLIDHFKRVANAKPEAQMERLGESAKKTAENIEEVGNQLSDLETHLDTLDNLKESFENLTVNTEEWRDSISAANDEINKLMESNPLFKKMLENPEAYNLTSDDIIKTEAGLIIGVSDNFRNTLVDTEKQFEKDLQAQKAAQEIYNANLKGEDYNDVTMSRVAGLGTNSGIESKVLANAISEWTTTYQNTLLDANVDASQKIAAAEKYAEDFYQNGFSDIKLNSDGSGFTLNYIDDNGDEQSGTISYEDISTYFGGQVGLSSYQETMDTLMHSMNVSGAEDLYKKFALGQGLGDFSFFDLADLPKTVEELQEKLGLDDDTFTALWTNLGYESSEAYWAAIQQDEDKYVNKDQVFDSLGGIVGKAYMSFGSAETISNLMSNSDVAFNQDNFNQMFGLNQFEGMTSAAYEAFYDRIAAIGDKWKDFNPDTMDVSSFMNDAENRNDLSIKAKSYGLDEDEMRTYSEQIRNMAKDDETLSDALEHQSNTADDLAVSWARMNKGLSTIKTNFESWNKIIKAGNKTSPEYIKTITDMRDAMADVFDLTEENKSLLSNSFLESAADSEDLQKALNGDAEALNRLRMQAADDIVAHFNIDESQLENFTTNYDLVKDYIANNDIQAGAYIDDTDFLNSLTEMINAAGLTAQEATGLLSTMGIDAEVIEHPVNEEVHATTSIPTFVRGPLGIPIFEGYQEYESISDSEGTVASLEVSNAFWNRASGGQFNVTTGDTGGGGGGKSKPASYSKVHEKFRDTDNSIDNLTKKVDKFSDAADGAFGATKLSLIKKQQSAIGDLAKEYQNLAAEAKSYLKEDQNAMFNNDALNKYDKANGTNYAAQIKSIAKFDENGNIANLEEIQHFWDKIGKSLEGNDDKLDAFNEMLKEQTDIYDEIQSDVEKYQEALEKNLELIKDYVEATLDAIDYSVELNIKINNHDLKIAELALKELGDKGSQGINKLTAAMNNFNTSVKNAEETEAAATKIMNILDTGKVNGNDENWFKQTFGADAWKEYKTTGQLTGAVIENLQGKLDELLNYKDQLINQYTAVWASWREALQEYMDQFDELTAKYDNAINRIQAWNNLIQTTNKQLTQANKLSMMNTSMKAAQGKVSAATSKRSLLESQIDDAQKAYDDAVKSKDAIRIQETKKNLDTVKQLYDEACTDELNALTEYYQQMKDQADDYYNYLQEQFMRSQGYTSTGAMSDAYNDRRASEDWYLDATNKEYGLNSLLRGVEEQNAVLTDPSRLKAYEEFMDRITAAKAKDVNLTQDELDIMNAEFELMKAEDAYKEAQAQKNTMRLVRDASGNYSYLFNNGSNNAAQKYEDAQNKLYNLQKQYQQKSEEGWIQTYEAYNEYVQNVDKVRYESDELYRQEVNAKYQWYTEQLNRYTNQIITADAMLGVDFKTTSLGVILDSDNMKDANDRFTQAVQTNVNTTSQWVNVERTTFDTLATGVGVDMDNMDTSVSNAMKNINSYLDTTKSEINSLASTVTSQMSKMSSTIAQQAQSICAAYQSIINKINETMAAISKYEHSGAENDDLYFNDYAAEIQRYMKEKGLTKADDYVKKLYAKREEKIANDTATYGKYASSSLDALLKDLGFATGGYTEDGGLAFIHDKELVLNKQDTENILNAVTVMRSVVDNQLGRKAMDLAVGHANGAAGSNSMTVDQNVKIDATFPGVSVASEIETAFNNLINQAAQYNLKK